jgi:phosphoserine aminotransferase
MPSRENIINFAAGPAMLPTPVLEQASQDLLNYHDTGMSLVEMSHRSSTAAGILKSANEHLRQLLSVPDTHEIIWQQGGGTAQFSMVVYNLVAAYVARGGDVRNMVADYIVTGGWSKKAYDEAVRLGVTKVNLAVNTKKEEGAAGPGKYGAIPPAGEWKCSDKAENVVYAYYCDNETVDGIEFPGGLEGVDPRVPVVCDMSSNILSRKVDVSKFAVIYVPPPQKTNKQTTPPTKQFPQSIQLHHTLGTNTFG